MAMAAYHRFRDRAEAGKVLAEALSSYEDMDNTLVLALPRGGVPVAHEIAKALKLPLDLWIVRKLGVPGHEELAMGAVAGDDIYVLNSEIIRLLNIDHDAIEEALDSEKAELKRRNELYRHGKPPVNVKGKTVIIVDDGLATGATMRAGIMSLREAGADRVIVAVPVGAASTCGEMEKDADEVICPVTPEPFYGVGQWYRDFSQTSDQEVQQILTMSGGNAPAGLYH